MKKLILLASMVSAVVMTACSEDAMQNHSKGGAAAVLFRGEAECVIATRAEVDVTTFGVTVPASGDFKLTLTGREIEGGSKTWDSVDQYNAQAVANPLEESTDYVAVVTYGDPAGEGVDKPYFYGEQAFTVTGGDEKSVTVNAAIANSLALVRTTAAFNQYFHDAEFTLTTEAGNTFTYKPAEKEMTTIFIPAGTSLTVGGKAYTQRQTDSDNGVEAVFAEQTLDATVARTRHIFTFDAQDSGSATLTINLDEQTEVITPVDVELNDYASKQ